MIEFFEQVTIVLTTGLDTISEAAKSLREYEFDDSLVFNYLGYMHYGMGTPLYYMFSTTALIGIGASLWSFIIKGINWLVEMIPGA